MSARIHPMVDVTRIFRQLHAVTFGRVTRSIDIVHHQWYALQLHMQSLRSAIFPSIPVRFFLCAIHVCTNNVVAYRP